jgi:ABC-type uncharacterized transport system substrate-binding protein
MSLCRPGSTECEADKDWLAFSVWLIPHPPVAKNLKAFRQSPHLGHVEDRNIAIEFRYADGNLDRPPSLATELVEQKVDIIVTVATLAAVAARKATSTIAQTYYGAVLVAADPLFFSEAALIAKLALKYQLPSMHQLRETAEAGGLISYGPDTTVLNRRAAIYVEAVLTGAKPADLPIQQPTKFELVLNLKTARALSLTISPTLLVRADEVIE